MSACRKLHDYAYFVSQVRENLREGLVLSEAVDRAALACIRQDVLKQFLEVHRTEVRQLILEEYDEELHLKTLYEEGMAAGEAKGKAAGLAEGKAAGTRAFQETLLHCIQQRWQLSEDLKTKILAQDRLETLQRWLTMAWQAASVEELEEKIAQTSA